MSLSGKLLRGIHWHNFRNLDGEYTPDVASDPHKMEEIKFYLNFIKDKDSKIISKILEKVRLADMQNKPKLMELEALKLLDIPIKVKEKILIPTKEETMKVIDIDKLADSKTDNPDSLPVGLKEIKTKGNKK